MTKEELQKYRALVEEREWLELRLNTFKALPNAPELVELEMRYVTLIEDLQRQALEIERAIEGLDPTARILLRYRYIDGCSWEEICVLMHYSWRQVHRIHAAALIKLKGEDNGEKNEEPRMPHPAAGGVLIP